VKGLVYVHTTPLQPLLRSKHPQGFKVRMGERERRAKIIAAEGEYQASERLRQAADRLESPTALQLRLFQTMGEIANEQN
jgi:hypothetical protein